MRKILSVGALAGLVLLFGAGCQKPPTADIEAARASLEKARQSEAKDYAPEAIQRANKTWESLDAELKLQEEKMAFRRKYDQAKVLVAQVNTEAAKAEEDGKKAKEAAKTQVEQGLTAARTTIDETKAAVANAPTGKGTQMDKAMMEQDVAELETTLVSIQQMYDQGQYKQAQQRLQQLNANATKIKTEIENAAAMQAAGKK